MNSNALTFTFNLGSALILSLMVEAKKFLLENSSETRTTTIVIHNVNVKSLTAFIRRQFKRKRGGHNLILKEHEVKAIDGYIRSLLAHEISSTYGIVFNAIVSLKKTHNSLDSGSSIR
jgi:hypothetical protein